MKNKNNALSNIRNEKTNAGNKIQFTARGTSVKDTSDFAEYLRNGKLYVYNREVIQNKCDVIFIGTAANRKKTYACMYITDSARKCNVTVPTWVRSYGTKPIHNYNRSTTHRKSNRLFIQLPTRKYTKKQKTIVTKTTEPVKKTLMQRIINWLRGGFE